MSPTVETRDTLVRAISAAVDRAAANLIGQQDPRGYWCAELTADTTLESDYILLQLWMHPPVDGVWNPPTRPLIEKAEIDLDVAVGRLQSAPSQNTFACER